MHRWQLLLVALVLGASALPAGMLSYHSAQAQQEERCFAETGFCIAGRIREFWEQNGGLAVFGLPTTPQREEIIEGRPLQVQWFERNRLELHPENEPPYDVLLGRLGVDVLEQQGRDWWTFPRSEPQADCRYFEQTWKNVCGEVLAAWRANGIEIDGQPGLSEAENLALFGLPVSALQVETLEDGQQYQVQWFERARFEIHPENEPPFNVLLGLLGNEVQPAAQPQEPQPQEPTAQPEPEPQPQEPTAQPQEPEEPAQPPKPGTSLLAFQTLRHGTYDIYTMNPDGSNKTRLTPSLANDVHPAWSPDGSQLAFTSDRDGNLEIYLMNADGSGLVRLTDNPARDETPVWSPDGQFIAFASDRNEHQDIYVLSVGSRELYRLTDDPGDDAFPAWSPSGSLIAFASSRGRDFDIYTMNIDGSNKDRLTDSDANDAYPSWSPDSQRIAYASGREGNWELYVMDVDGSNETRMTEVAADDIQPAWSPDGGFIAFESNRDANWEIYVMDMGTLAQQRLTSHPARDSAAAWSPPR